MTQLSNLKDTAKKNSINKDMLEHNNLPTLHTLEMEISNPNNPDIVKKIEFFDYCQRVLLDKASKDFSEKELKHIQDVLSIPRGKRYEQMFNDFVPCASELTENQIQRAIIMYDNALLLAQNLQKNNLSTYPAHICLSGGAVRDFLFLKDAHIKDLDFLISFKQEDTHKYDPLNTSFFSTDDFEKKQKNNTLNLNQEHWLSPIFFSLYILNGLVSLKYKETDTYKKNYKIFQENVLKDNPRYKEIESSFEFSSFLRYELECNGFIGNEAVYIGLFEQNLLSQMKWQDYINQGLGATIKTTGIDGIPMDLLVAKNSMIDVIHSFDFCICKSSINFSEILEFHKKHPQASIIDKLTFIYENLFIPQTTLTDVKLKELSISAQYSCDVEKIRYFMDKHGERLLKKYPDFTFNLPNSKFHLGLKNRLLSILTQKGIYDNAIKHSSTTDTNIKEAVDDLFKL